MFPETYKMGKRGKGKNKTNPDGTPKKILNPIPAKVRKMMLEAFESERNFIDEVFKHVPKKQVPNYDGYLLDTKKEKEEKLKEDYEARIKSKLKLKAWHNDSEDSTPPLPPPTRQELVEKLHAKIAEKGINYLLLTIVYATIRLPLLKLILQVQTGRTRADAFFNTPTYTFIFNTYLQL